MKFSKIFDKKAQNKNKAKWKDNDCNAINQNDLCKIK